ncbi:MAG: hypothetical protein DHS20C09_07580 [marine bacterium B5-7]|nr:MAG: hypothetical protein DHS20C09_07580 [marine bacterium B5-7]
MKNVTLFLVSVLALLGGNVLAKDYFIALSPFDSADVVKKQAQVILEWAVQLEPGDKVTFLDGYSLNTLGRFDVPESDIYKSPRARLNANREAVGQLLRFADGAALPSGSNQPSVRGAILLPQLLRQIALQPTTYEKYEVVVMASPVYDHPAQPNWSMAGRRFPGDGNIFSSRSQSPYAAADTPELLAGFRVHLAYDEAVGNMNIDAYAYRVQRYFTLFIEAQGGQLVSFTTDNDTALARARTNALATAHQFKADQENNGEASLYEREVIHEVLSRAELRQARKVSIGLTWDCESCDLDLYARSSVDTEILYYDNPSSREGVVRKEFPLSYQDQGNKGFETVYYTTAVNLEKVIIAVNFYEGSAPKGVAAELRIDIAGKTYAKDILIPALEGNRGSDALDAIEQGASTSPHTLIIRPLDVIAHD